MRSEALKKLFSGRQRRFDDMCSEVLGSIEVMKVTGAGSSPSLDQLDTAARELRRIRTIVRTGNLPDHEHRQIPHRRTRIDSWPLGCELGDRLSELETFYRQM